MKTFGLFMLILLIYILVIFNLLKNITIDEMLKLIIATQMAYIVYRLIKEETKEL